MAEALRPLQAVLTLVTTSTPSRTNTNNNTTITCLR
jgi:hypothetical protein